MKKGKVEGICQNIVLFLLFPIKEKKTLAHLIHTYIKNLFILPTIIFEIFPKKISYDVGLIIKSNEIRFLILLHLLLFQYLQQNS